METDLTVMFRIFPLGYIADDDNWFGDREEIDAEVKGMNDLGIPNVEFSVIEEVL